MFCVASCVEPKPKTLNAQVLVKATSSWQHRKENLAADEKVRPNRNPKLETATPRTRNPAHENTLPNLYASSPK